MKRKCFPLVVLAALFAVAGLSSAIAKPKKPASRPPAAAKPTGLRMPNFFSDNMVLERGIAVPVWGWDEPSQSVSVTIQGQTQSAKAGADGAWRVTLRPLAAGGPLEMTVKGSKTLVVRNVMVGEVWICSGQSNMAFTLAQTDNAAKTIAASANPQLREFKIPNTSAAAPQANCPGAWQVASPKTTPHFSAVAYHFGAALQRELKVPVGLINTSWGGTPIERWLGRGDINNAMIAPLAGYGIAGATWYQGEANAGRALLYRKQLPLMIKTWRDQWRQGDFPFLIVSLANFHAGPKGDWPALREAQAMAAASVPKTGLAITIDVGNPKDIHPRNKRTVGERLALNALAIAYGKKIVYSGPVYESMGFEGNKVRLRFKHVGGGLMAKGNKLAGFVVAGADKKFVPANASIDGAAVIVSSPNVAHPTAVRYAWADNPTCNLYNKEGLPAVPFRTDPE